MSANRINLASRLTMLACALATVPLCAVAQSTVGDRLDRLVAIRAQTELLRQESALREEMLKGSSLTLPAIVAITGPTNALTARLLLDDGAQRAYLAGDAIGGGWRILSVLADEVLVVRDTPKATVLRPVPLSFARRDSQSPPAGRWTPPPVVPTSYAPPYVPPLPNVSPMPPGFVMPTSLTAPAASSK